MRLPSVDFRFFHAAAACAAMALATVMRAAEAHFVEELSEGERTAMGAPKLTAPQVAVLDGLLARDVRLAHEGGVTGFSSRFSERRTPQEIASAGINRLSGQELTALDTLAARAIAQGPPPEQTFSYSPPTPVSPPPPPPPTLVSAPPKAEVHGDISLTVGAGSHGSNFFGTSLDLFVTDPSGKYTLGVGLSEYRGKGFLGPFGPYEPFFDLPAYRD